ncbi:thymidylate synthase [Streptomyces sp. NPDC005322]|uniref:thymidylate synthase n=1 Tax=Streptomyces sp. NPDC005322 TaxID=3157032 RepID=UPI00339EE2E5
MSRGAVADLPGSVADAVDQAVAHLVRNGEEVRTAAGKAWLETLGFTTGMSNPRKRILHPASGTFDIIGAASRFVWMMRGDQSLSAVAYYVPRAAAYSPDGTVLPGSSYGHRLRRSIPGVDQVEGVIARLQQNSETRQAATVIWNPMDAVREPVDIPCAFGTQYHLRAQGLVGTTMMRSNKPLTLMPFNFFEFSLLAEVIAAEVDAPLASYRHWIAAMQLPLPELARAEVFLGGQSSAVEMSAMPRSPRPLDQLGYLCRWEESIRTASSETEVEELLCLAAENLDPYWLAFADLLSLQWFLRRDRRSAVPRLVSRLPEHFADPLEAQLCARTKQS